jgi:hypothetical protein
MHVFACLIHLRRYLKDAATARRLTGSLDKPATLSAARSDEKELNTAFVWELAAQCIMYIMSCIAIVFACITASRRLRKLNSDLELRTAEADGAKLVSHPSSPSGAVSPVMSAGSALRSKVSV